MYRRQQDRRHTIPVVLALTALLTTTVLAEGCSHAPPNTTPQAAVAHYGTDVIQGVNAVQAAVIAATESTPPILTVDRARPVMDKLRQALDLGQQLSVALKAYDAATTPADKQNIAAKIQALLGGITSAVASAGAADMPQALLAQTSALVANVANTINTVRAAVKLTPATP